MKTGRRRGKRGRRERRGKKREQWGGGERMEGEVGKEGEEEEGMTESSSNRHRKNEVKLSQTVAASSE